jgi:outer membrane biosynthesis protein TonB
MDLEKIIKKRADVNTEETAKKLPIDLKDKRILIGGGIIGGLFLVVLLGKMFGGGGEVIQVQQGVGTKEVKAIVDESTKPLAEKLQEQEQINKQLLDMLKKQQENGEQKQEEKKEEKKEGKKEEPSPLGSLFPSPEPTQPQPQPLPTPQPAPTPAPAPSSTLPEPEKEPPKPKLNHKSLGTAKDDKDSSSLSSSSTNGSNNNANIEKELGLDDNRPMYLFPPDENSQSASTSSSNGSNVKKKKSVYIPAGSVTYGTLLYSFTAPSDGMFPPVVIEISKSAVTANHWKVPIEKCFLLVKAQYDLATERALLGGNDSIMSCVLRNGYVIEKKVNVAIGEEVNGNVQMGLSGVEKWLTGEDFAKLATLTTAQGMAAGLQQSLVQQSMTTYGSTITAIKNNGEYAILNGINNTFAKFYDFWMKKYDKKTPAIYVSAPRVVFITFVNGVDLDVSDKDLKF